MNLKSLENAVATARKEARVLEIKAQQSGQAVRAAKGRTRQAKSKLKLAKQHAKQARKAAKDAKRAFAEALFAAEGAAARVAVLEKKIKKARKKAEPAHARNGKPKQAIAHRRIATKPQTPARKSTGVKSPAWRAAAAKPAGRHGSAPRQRKLVRPASKIHVPRDFEVKTADMPSGIASGDGPSTLSADEISSLTGLPLPER